MCYNIAKDYSKNEREGDRVYIKKYSNNIHLLEYRLFSFQSHLMGS